MIYAEAARYSQPRIRLTAGGVPELVTHNETGLLVAPDDVVRLFAALEAVCASPDLAGTLGTSGLACREAEFTVPFMAARLAEAHHFAQFTADIVRRA